MTLVSTTPGRRGARRAPPSRGLLRRCALRRHALIPQSSASLLLSLSARGTQSGVSLETSCHPFSGTGRSCWNCCRASAARPRASNGISNRISNGSTDMCVFLCHALEGVSPKFPISVALGRMRCVQRGSRDAFSLSLSLSLSTLVRPLSLSLKIQ